MSDGTGRRAEGKPAAVFLTVFSAETLGWRNQFWQRYAATVRTEVGLTPAR